MTINRKRDIIKQHTQSSPQNIVPPPISEQGEYNPFLNYKKNKIKKRQQRTAAIWFWISFAISGTFCGILLSTLGKNYQGMASPCIIDYYLIIFFGSIISFPGIAISVTLTLGANIERKTKIFRYCTHATLILIIGTVILFRPALINLINEGKETWRMASM